MNIKQLTFPAYFKQGSIYTAILSEKELLQVRLYKTQTVITRSQNRHELEQVLTGQMSTAAVFNAAAKQAEQRLTVTG